MFKNENVGEIMTNKNARKRVIFLGAVLVAVGLLGTVCFFPMNINSTYTCLFHQFFVEGIHDHSSHIQSNSIEGKHSHDSPLLNYYLVRFGFLWWGSISLFVVGFYTIKKKSNISLIPQFQIWR